MNSTPKRFTKKKNISKKSVVFQYSFYHFPTNFFFHTLISNFFQVIYNPIHSNKHWTLILFIKMENNSHSITSRLKFLCGFISNNIFFFILEDFKLLLSLMLFYLTRLIFPYFVMLS